MLTPYNLPPNDCMKEPFMFLTVLVPGPDDPGQKLDVFLQPLMKELIELWEDGILAYDVSTKTNFTLRAALLWTVSDFPAYSMLSGRKTSGFHACPHCLEDTDAFRLEKSGKESWFDCHRRFLPLDHPLRQDKTHFLKNKVERKGPPRKLTGEQVYAIIEHLGLLPYWLISASCISIEFTFLLSDKLLININFCSHLFTPSSLLFRSYKKYQQDVIDDAARVVYRGSQGIEIFPGPETRVR